VIGDIAALTIGAASCGQEGIVEIAVYL